MNILSRAKRNLPVLFWAALMLLMASETVLLAFSSWQNRDASTWTDDDVRQILTNSPWVKKATADLAHVQQSGVDEPGQSPADGPESPDAARPTWGNGGPWGSDRAEMPSSAGRGGWGRMETPGRGERTNGRNNPLPEVVVQWRSALPVRLAVKKHAGEDWKALAAAEEYVLTVTGLPNSTEDQLKNATALIRNGHDPIYPTKVEISKDAAFSATMYFPKTDPIMSVEKNVNLRIYVERITLNAKFALRAMRYQGQLEL